MGGRGGGGEGEGGRGGGGERGRGGGGGGGGERRESERSRYSSTAFRFNPGSRQIFFRSREADIPPQHSGSIPGLGRNFSFIITIFSTSIYILSIIYFF